MWAIGSQQFFRAGAYIFLGTWFTTFLERSRAVQPSDAATLTALPLLGIVAAGPIGGWLSDYLLERTGSRRIGRQAFAIVTLLAAATFLAAAFFLDDPHACTAAVTAGSFCAGLAGVAAYAITIDMGGSHVGSVFSLMNLCGNLGATLSPVLIGRLVSATGNWNASLLLLALAYLTAAICWVALNPNGSVAQD
jgi:nitrate/nitrite transporter NarK